MNKLLKILVLFCLIEVVSVPGFSADKSISGTADSKQNQQTASLVFKKIEEGIATGKVSAISNFFSSQMYLSLSNGVNGYYSSNQAYYVLQGYFKNYRVISFSIQNIHDEDENVVGTGDYAYSFKGKEGKAKVYISLKKAGNKWKITQLTID